jgi:Mg-chelatase subunit ChlI
MTDSTDLLRASLAAVRAEVGKAVVGQDGAVTGLIIALLAGGHVLLEGVPGVAKTLLVRSLSAAMRLDTKRIQFTPDLMPGDITGSAVYDPKSGEFEFREGPVFTNILLADEINRTPPKTQAALLEAMEERQVSADGVTRKLPAPFLVAATMNPIEYEGTYTLPEAQLDRFLLKLVLDLPERDVELEVLQRHANGFNPRDLAAAESPGGCRHRHGQPGRSRVRRRPRPRHTTQPVGETRRLAARHDGLARRVAGLGVALRLHGGDPRPHPDDGRAGAAPPHPAAHRGRTRRRRARHGAALGDPAGAGADLMGG